MIFGTTIEGFSRRRISVFLVVLTSMMAASGCAPRADTAGIVPDSTLALIIADLYLADANLQILALSDSLAPAPRDLEISSSPLRDSILAAHGLGEEQFMEVMEGFITDPARYVGLFDQVLDHMNEEKRIRETPAEAE